MNKKQRSFVRILFVTLGFIVLVGIGFVTVQSKYNASSQQKKQPSQTTITPHQEENHGSYQEPAFEEADIRAIEIGQYCTFSPEILDITAGTTVAFINYDTREHRVIADDGYFDTGLLKPGEQIPTVQYTQAGTYAFHCFSNPERTGEIIVTE